jgi:hypothetical protein
LCGSHAMDAWLVCGNDRPDKRAILLRALRLPHQVSITKMRLFEIFTAACNAQGRLQKKHSFKV